LSWDNAVQSVTVSNGTPETTFTFNLTNKSTGDVTITGASGSCYCTVAKMPELPWKIPAGGGGQIRVVMNLVNRVGSLPKTVTVVSDKGVKVLYVTATILAPPTPVRMAPLERERNQKIAIVDRQAVFRGDCARCHAEPARNQMGQALFTQACGVCHESDRRASVVPDLRAIQQQTNGEFWRKWIVHGKPGSLMPAFSQSEGGILTEAQITSLVNYLTATIPSRPPAQALKSHAKRD
jgi:mono/diheme cytochrome c family protein